MRRVALLLLTGCAAALGQAGRADRQRPDPEAAARGRAVYLQYCINCHGSLLQGTDDGPDLVRSVIVLHDTLGSEIGPALQKRPNHERNLEREQIADLSHFLKQRIEFVVQNRNPTQPPNVLTGNAQAGRAYFNGAGKCSACHSAEGDLKGIGARLDPVTLQQRFLFPRPQPIQVKITTPTEKVSGTLVRVDDFSVAIKDAAGEFRTYQRTSDTKVDLEDPLAEHHALLDVYTDSDMHNVVAYLESLK